VSWNPYQSPVDYFILAGKKSPGIATIQGAERARKYDERNGYGLGGASLIYNGRKLAHFSAMIRLYSPKDWQDWAVFRPLVQKIPKPVFTADGAISFAQGSGVLDFWHPLLEPLGIKSVVVEDEVQPVLEDETGVWLVEIKFIQYSPPVREISKPKGSQGKAPLDAVDQKILANSETIRAMGEELAK
jgi:hypothetical protein